MSIKITKIVSEFFPVTELGEHKELGTRGVCPCPFCKGSVLAKTMILSDKKDEYNCFSCGASGNTTDFLIKAKGYTKEQALDYLNGKSNVYEDKSYNLIKTKHYLEEETNKNNEMFYKINGIACKHYYDSLKQNQEAYNYLKSRKITDETIRKFSIGYSKYGIGEILKESKISKSLAINCGLINNKGNDNEYKDKMFNRIMFPIMVKDKNGDNRIAGFGGRLITYPDPKFKDSPKYLNTITTKVFDKSRTLFAFNYAQDSKKNGFILCEGYMDVISLHQAGFDNAIASLGTSFTPYHAKMIKDYKDTVYLCFDSDEAGTKAKLKAIPILRNEDIDVKVIDCSPYKDPDEFIKAKGKEAFKEVLNNAIDSYEFEIKQLMDMCVKENKDFDYEFAHKTYKTHQKEFNGYLKAYDSYIEKQNINENININNDENNNKKNVNNNITNKNEELNSSNENPNKENSCVRENYQEVLDEYDFEFE